MQRILAFDTASETLALAAGTFSDGAVDVLAAGDAPAPRRANQVLLERAAQVVGRAGWQVRDLDAVVVGRGPGSFTGVRIGVATAKGMACALPCPLYGVSTLDAVAWSAWRGGLRGRVGVVADAMRKEVYPARFVLDGDGVRRVDVDSVAKPADVAAEWASAAERLVLVGNGLRKFADLFDAACFEIGDEALWAPSGEGLLLAYADDVANGRAGSGDAATLLPVYTRLSDAEENERARLNLPQELPESGVADARAEGGLFLHPMSINDVPDVVALQGRALPDDAWTAGKLADELGRPDRSWWIARRGGAVVGCAGGQVVAGELSVFQVCVERDLRRQGIGTRLLERVATDGRALGAETVTLEVRVGNAEAIALYRELGLEDVGVRPGYYHAVDGVRADALVMRGPLPLSIPVRGGRSGGMAVSGRGHGGSARAQRPLVLAIESSCDETAAAVVDGARGVVSDVVASQIDFHSRFGGVVPEIASRKHTEAIVPTVMDALDRAGLGFSDLSAIAVTQGPGLVGALVVGLAFAKGVSFVTGLPLVCVNHLEGHLYANRFIDPDMEPPFVALLVSGGHTMLVHVKSWGDYEVLGSTLDDAVGEAFDKVAKALGLGYPGGPIISRLAAEGDPSAIDFPRAMLHSGTLEFSLSGLKTAVVTYIRKCNEEGAAVDIPDLAASFQAAVVDVQVAKALEACRRTGVELFCMGGGVAANPALRSAVTEQLGRHGIRVIVPDPRSCTDNATMIGSVALDLYEQGSFGSLSDDPMAHMPLRSKAS